MSYSKGFRFKECQLGVFKNDADVVVEQLQESDRVMGLTDGSFSLIDLIHSILKNYGRSNIILSTWSAGIKDVNQVKWMVNSELIHDFKIITDHSYKTRQKKYACEIERIFGLENIRTAESHSKFTLIQCESGEKITIRTSMNLNANKTCENFEIDVCEDVYGFYKEWADIHFDGLPDGFTNESFKVGKISDEYFNNETKTAKKWWSNE